MEIIASTTSTGVWGTWSIRIDVVEQKEMELCFNEMLASTVLPS